MVHDVVWEHTNGPIPKGLEPDHTCHTDDKGCCGGPTCPHRACSNPTHMELVTHRVNLARGRTINARNLAATHCPQGHPYDEANTRWNKDGSRGCKACTSTRSLAWYEANPAAKAARKDYFKQYNEVRRRARARAA